MFLRTKIAASFETAKRILLKDVKGFGKVRFTVKLNFRFECYPRLDFLAAIRAEGEPITFKVGGDAGSGAAFLAGVPGCVHGLVNEMSDILWCVVVVNTEAAELLLDLAYLDGRSRMGSIEGIDGRCNFLYHRPPSLSALPGHFFDGFHHFSLNEFLQGQRASTAIMVRPMKWPFGARFGSPVCSW